MNNKKIRLLVVIINYKTPELVCDALISLANEINFNIDRVAIIDNNSKDNSISKIDAFIESNDWQDWCEVIPSNINGGFSAGNNIGIQSTEAEYYLLLNSDTLVRDNAINALLETAKSDSSLGIIGPRLEWLDGKQQVSCFYNLSPANSFLHSVKIGVFTRLFGLFGTHEVAIPTEQHEITKPDWLSFACVLLSGKMVREVGLMDEGYFMYREDNDYCRRAVNAGWKLKYEAKARVVHLNKGSSNKMGVTRLPKYYFNSRARYFVKYYGRLGLLTANIFWSVGRCISLLRETVSRKPRVFHITMWLDIWTGFFSRQEWHEK